MSAYWIQGGRLINPGADQDGAFDVLIVDDTVAKILPAGTAVDKPADTETIDAAGCWVTPGLIDMHVHFRDPGYEYKETLESGANAAAAGGFTHVCTMPNTKPVCDNAQVIEYIRHRAGETACIHIHPVGAVSKGLKGEEMAEIAGMLRAGAVAFSDDGHSVMNASLLRRVMEYARGFEQVIVSHCEDNHLSHGGQINEGVVCHKLGLAGIPPAAEIVHVARDLELAALTGCRLHIAHISTAEGVDLVRRARDNGWPVTSEAAPHHWAFTEELCMDYDPNSKMYPPLRMDPDTAAIRSGLQDGTIDAIATDHAPHHDSEKQQVEFANAERGIIGLETSLPLALGLVRDGTLSERRLVELYTTGPAACLQRPQWGVLEEGQRADVTVIDPEVRWVYSRDQVRSRSANSPLIDKELQGRARAVFCRGQKVFSSE